MESLKNLIVRFSKWEYSGLCLLVLVMLVVHLSVLMQPNEPFLYDEQHYVPDARVIMGGDATERPEHPPLSKLFIIAGMELFGDNAVGWRFFPIVFSLSGIVFLYLICRRLNLSKRVSFIATFILGLENLSFVMGSIAMLDVYSVTFTLLAFWLYLKKRYVMSGVAVGISALAKLTGALAILVIGLHWILNGDLTSKWLPQPLPGRLKERGTRRLWWLLYRGLVILDMLLIVLLLGAAWLYFRESYTLFGIDIGLDALAIATAVLSVLIIIMHSIFTRMMTDAWRLVGRSVTAISLGLGRRCFTVWLFLKKTWHRVLILPTALAVGLVFIGLMPVLDFGVFHKWMNPVERIQKMMEISGDINYNQPWVEAGTGSRPWIWVLTPEVNQIWYNPHYSVMISPTLWVFIMPLVLYITYRAIRGNTLVLFPLSWFIGAYLFWIPTSLITDRVTYLFYIYPTIGAIAIGLAIAISPLLNRAIGRGLIAVYLLLHAIAFIVLAPVALCWSIPLCLLLYIFTFWFTGLGEGLRFRRKAKLPETQVDMPPEQ
jgi:hypothetical protein